ncbi:hypothetical protein PS15m_009943 [Mucor circinelloides]
MEAFKSPTRPTSQTTASLSNYVDYTPRRIQASSFDHSLGKDEPNSINYAKQRRSNFYHQIALEADENFDEKSDYMDSPAVRRIFSINEEVIDVEKNRSFHASNQSRPPLPSFPQRTHWTIKDFAVGHNLGMGRFGSVYLAKEKRSGQLVALKILKKQELEEAEVVLFLKREIEIQGHLNHPNITRLYGYFHNEDNVYLVLEYAGDSDLYTCLETFKRFSEAETVNYVIEIADALAYMHRLGVFHRDIKLENILISKEGGLKIADFGWAVYDPKPRRTTFCGTLDYLPPEMIKRQTHNESVDAWALGILCYELLVGRPPFETDKVAPQDLEKAYRRIAESPLEFPIDISVHAQNFISKLLHKDPSLRMKMSEIESDPWVKSFHMMNV